MGRYRLDTWDDAAETTLHASAGSMDDVFATALTALLLIARGEGGDGEVAAEPESSIAVPIRGQGGDYAALFTELAGDLLAQLDANGSGLGFVRLDGLLETDTGYSAWGYALGAERGPKPVLGLNLIGIPTISHGGDRTSLSVRLRQST
ncbi:MAG TPA: hypothetical protein VGR16_05780 [Thermomicrobiales bacterium]|nr:hypothetical protein [Thermomicrobiales bacterium]